MMTRNDGSSLKDSDLVCSTIHDAGRRFRPFKASLALLLMGLCMLVWPTAVAAQESGNMYQNTKNNPDQSLRSEAHIDPATHGMNIEIPLGGLPGRAGLNLPVSISYSSKVWRIGDVDSVEWALGGGHFLSFTSILPKFGEYSAAGWTSSLNPPRIDYTFHDEGYFNYDGQGGGPDGYVSVIGRINVHMPDGSTHELRRSDAPINSYSYYPSGTYYAVDGSQLRYDYDAKTLYMPDSSRYVFAEVYNLPGERLQVLLIASSMPHITPSKR